MLENTAQQVLPGGVETMDKEVVEVFDTCPLTCMGPMAGCTQKGCMTSNPGIQTCCKQASHT